MCLQLKRFLDEKRGKVAVSEARCILARVDLSIKSPSKKFSNMVYQNQFSTNFKVERTKLLSQFLDAAVELTKAADKDPIHQGWVFRMFVKEFGTHFSKNTWMGVKVYAERRYTEQVK